MTIQYESRVAAVGTNQQQRSETVVAIEGLQKIYGELEAVRNLSLDIYRGEIFGLLGPNGAGKTTTLEIAVGLRTPTSGRVSVLGCDPQSERASLVRKIGVQPQEASLFPTLKVVETLCLFASFHANPLTVDYTLDLIGLAEKRNSLVKSLSGGQRQRLLLGIAFIADPQLLFLDEPTGPLDPQARRQLWDIIEDFRAQQRTVVMTTHSMEEAEALCDRVAIIDAGQIIALGTPAELVRKHFPIKTLSFDTSGTPDEQSFQQLAGVRSVKIRGGRVEIVTGSSDNALREVLSRPDCYNIDARGGSLEDVFLTLTGRNIREE